MPELMGVQIRADDISAFGGCPECGQSSGYVHRGCKRWIYCDIHKVKWCGGEILSCHWEVETSEDYTRAESRVSSYAEVEPLAAACPVMVEAEPEMTDVELVECLRNLATLIEYSPNHHCQDMTGEA